MPTKITTKAVKITSMTMGLMIGTMIAGAGLATAGWWYSDRLDIAGLLGQTSDINEIDSGYKAKREAAKKSQCKNGCSYETKNSQGQKIRITTTKLDEPQFRYIKTKSGFQIKIPMTQADKVVGGGWNITQEVIYTPAELREIARQRKLDEQNN